MNLNMTEKLKKKRIKKKFSKNALNRKLITLIKTSRMHHANKPSKSCNVKRGLFKNKGSLVG